MTCTRHGRTRQRNTRQIIWEAKLKRASPACRHGRGESCSMCSFLAEPCSADNGETWAIFVANISRRPHRRFHDHDGCSTEERYRIKRTEVLPHGNQMTSRLYLFQMPLEVFSYRAHSLPVNDLRTLNLPSTPQSSGRVFAET